MFEVDLNRHFQGNFTNVQAITGRVNWRWPEKDDILTYDLEDIVKKINEPIQLNKRGVYSVIDI